MTINLSRQEAKALLSKPKRSKYLGISGHARCNVNECERPAKTRGMCNAHYLRWRLHGDPSVGKELKAIEIKYCSVQGCISPVAAKGLCSTHYNRKKVFGSETSGKPNCEAIRYLYSTVLKYEGDYCLRWPFVINADGYGFYGKDTVGRIICKELYGEEQGIGMHAAHSCGNGHLACCTPRHLRWATPKENGEDAVLHGRSLRGAKSPSCKLSEEKVTEIRTMLGKVSLRKIANLYGVSVSTVHHIHQGKTWGWLP